MFPVHCLYLRTRIENCHSATRLLQRSPKRCLGFVYAAVMVGVPFQRKGFRRFLSMSDARWRGLLVLPVRGGGS